METENNSKLGTIPIEVVRKIAACYLNTNPPVSLITYEAGRNITKTSLLLYGRQIDDMKLGELPSICNLKPLWEISDEDKTAVFKIETLYNENSLIDDLKGLQFSGRFIHDKICYSVEFADNFEECKLSGTSTEERPLTFKSYQYLQTKSYALPYGPYSVEQLVKAGIYKF